MENIDLNKIHDIEMEILDVIDDFCKKNDINYSLYCGSLLGAVRHKGFIPWDDDIDICMLRKDYNKFIRLWVQSKNKDYVIQNKYTTPLYTQSFTKIRKNHTTFIQEKDPFLDDGGLKGICHTGIFVDILPLDRYPNGRLERYLFKWNLMNYLLFTREFVPENSNILVRLFSGVQLALNKGADRRKALRKKYLHRVAKYNNDKSLGLVSANTLDGLRHVMPAGLDEEYTQYAFEDREYRGFKDYDGLLKAWYGNYMALPPEEDRVWKHRPVAVSFEKNYREKGKK